MSNVYTVEYFKCIYLSASACVKLTEKAESCSLLHVLCMLTVYIYLPTTYKTSSTMCSFLCYKRARNYEKCVR